MKLYPAIDLLSGACVRLKQGVLEDQTVYGLDPVKMAKRWKDAGAQRLHVVNLDGAVDGMWSAETKKMLIDMIGVGIPLQVGGGIRNQTMAKWLLDQGVETCVIGTAAVERPKWVIELAQVYGDRIAVGVDVRDGMVATRGWLVQSKQPRDAFIERLEWMGIKKLILTEISCDGAMNGPDFEGLKQAKTLFSGEIIASGGISATDDLRIIKEMGLSGAIVGKALYEEAFTVEQAEEVCQSA